MSDVVNLLEKRRKVELLKQRKKLVRENGLAFFRPHAKQEQFFTAGAYKRRYARTGNRFGKSEMGAAEDCAWAIGERTFFPVGHPLRTLGLPKHSTKGCIVVQDWDKANEIFTSYVEEGGAAQGKLFRFLPKDRIIAAKKGRSGAGIAEIHIKSIHGGTSVISIETVRSFVQNPMGCESSSWDWIHVDEPCPYDMWVALSRGLVDRGGSAWFTCTPLIEPWINDYFIPRHLTHARIDQPLANDETSKWVMTGSMHDNPYNSKEAIKAYEGDLNEDERACRIAGIPLALSGLVYKNFSRDHHIYTETPKGWRDATTPPPSYTIRVLIDPHPKIPHAVMFFATAPTGQTYVYRELFRQGLISDLVSTIVHVVGTYHVEDYLIDPIAFIENPITGTCMADEFYAAGLPVVPAIKDLTYGILKTNDRFNEREDGHATIFFHDSLDTFLFEIDRYVWDLKKERPVDRDDHMMECLYRAVLTGLTYVKETSHAVHYSPPNVTSQAWNGPRLRELTAFTKKEVKRHNFSQRCPN